MRHQGRQVRRNSGRGGKLPFDEDRAVNNVGTNRWVPISSVNNMTSVGSFRRCSLVPSHTRYGHTDGRNLILSGITRLTGFRYTQLLATLLLAWAVFLLLLP